VTELEKRKGKIVGRAAAEGFLTIEKGTFSHLVGRVYREKAPHEGRGEAEATGPM